MYLEIENLTPEEAKTINEMFNGRTRLIHNIYTEVCRLEADCTIDMLCLDEEIEPIPEEKYNTVLDRLALKIADHCDSVFQDLADRSYEVVTDMINDVLESI